MNAHTVSGYQVLLERDEATDLILGHVLELPGCIGHGSTVQEALAGTGDAIRQWVERAAALGRPVPPPAPRG